MRKTSVYLTAEETARLAKLAEREGTSQAEVIRRAIRRYESETRGDRNFSLTRSADGPGGSISELIGDDLLRVSGSDPDPGRSATGGAC